VEKRLLLDGIHSYRGDIVVDEGIESAILIESGSAITCLVRRNAASALTQLALNLSVFQLFVEHGFVHYNPH
jgi:hypothetical protein